MDEENKELINDENNENESVEEEKKEEKEEKKPLDPSKKSLLIKICVWVGVALVLATAIGLSIYFAVRKGAKITVYFNTDVAEIESMVIQRGTMPDLPVLTQEGYEFVGWYTEDNELADADFFRKYSYLHDLYLHAVWLIKDPVTITYVSRGGTSVDPVQIARGDAPRAMAQTEREGYYFLGWCFDEYCLRIFNPDYDVVTEDVNLYAKWMPKTLDESHVVTLAYNVGNGTPVNTANLIVGDKIPLETTHYTGYVFDGWYVDPAYKYPVTDEMIITLASTVYAKWVKSDYRPRITTYVPIGAPQAEEKEFEYDRLIDSDDLVPPEWEDHVFTGYFYNDEYTDPLEYPFYLSVDTVIYARYRDETPDQVTVYYYDNVDHATSIVYAAGSTLQYYIPEREGYIFEGWYADPEYAVDFDFENTKASYDLCIYAKWTSLNEFSDSTFGYDLSEDGTYLIATSLVNPQAKNIVIPDECGGLPVRELAAGLFATCPIEKITVGNNLKKIGVGAFRDSYISAVELPVNVEYIEDEAFYHAYNLKTVVAKGQVTVGDYAFYRCETLKSVDLSYAKDLGDYVFAESGIESASLTYVLSVGHSTFKDCYSLSSVDISQSIIQTIGVDSFRNCVALKTLTIPKAVKTLANNCFNSSGLTSFNTNGVETIENSAFMGCASLTRVTVGSELRNLQTSAFADCTALEAFKVNNNANYSSLENDGSLYNSDATRLILYAGSTDDYLVPSSVAFISQGAFMLANYLKSVSVQAGNITYKAIGGNLFTSDGAKLVYFADTNASEYYLPDGVKSIESMAFSRKQKLCKVYLSKDVENVDYWAFYDDISLNEISCPNKTVSDLVEANMNEDNVPNVVYLCPKVTVTVAE